MFKKISIVALIAALTPILAVAQQQRVLSLSEALQIAVQRNHSIRIAKNTAIISANNATAGNANLLPRVEATGSFNRTNESFEATSTSPQFNPDTSGVITDVTSASISATYTLFDGFGNYYTFKSLQKLKEQSGIQARLQVEATLLEVIQFYLNSITAREAVRINESAIDRSLSRLDRVRKRFDVGSATRLDVLNAEVDLNTDSVAWIQANTSFINAKRDLLVNLGMDPSESIDIQEGVDLDLSLQLEELMSQAQSQNSSLVISKLLAENAEYSLKQTKATRFPVISLNGAYNYTRTDGGAGLFTSTLSNGLTGGISIRLNLFNGRQQEIRIKNAQIELKNNKEDLEFTKKSLDRDVLNTYEQYKTNLFLLKKEALNLQTANLNFTRTSELFDLGQVSSTDFREAQLNILRVEERIVSLKVQAKTSEVLLFQLAGKLITE